MNAVQAIVGYLVVFGTAIVVVIIDTALLLRISNKLRKKPYEKSDWTKNLSISDASFSGRFYDRKSIRR